MNLHRMVNGVQIQMTPQEEAAMLAEWAVNDPVKALPRSKTVTVDEKLARIGLTVADLKAALANNIRI